MMNLFKKTKLNLILASAMMIVLGIVLVLNPVNATVLLCRIAGFFLLMTGLFITGSYFLNASQGVGNSSLVLGLIEIAIGAWIILKPEGIITFLTAILGFVLLIHGFGLLQGAIEIKRCKLKYWWTVLILAILSVIAGIIIIVSPFGTAAVAMIIAGVSLIFDGVSGIILTVIFTKVFKAVDEEIKVIDVSDEELH